MSNALLKMAELGLTRAAAVLLQSGANLNFEGQQHPEDGGGASRARQPGLASALPLVLEVTFFGLLSGGSSHTSSRSIVLTMEKVHGQCPGLREGDFLFSELSCRFCCGPRGGKINDTRHKLQHAA